MTQKGLIHHKAKQPSNQATNTITKVVSFILIDSLDCFLGLSLLNINLSEFDCHWVPDANYLLSEQVDL